MNAALARAPWKGRQRRMPSIITSRQLTATETLIDRNEPSENDVEHTITESHSLDLHMTPAWLSDTLEQLQAIAALPNGWDSNDASSPDANKLEAAWSLLVCLCQNTDISKPHVNPTRNGGVQFEWEAGEHYFEIEVDATIEATFLFCDYATHVEETGRIFQENDLLEPVRAYIRKVMSLQ